MKVLISVDLEGVAGVVAGSHVSPSEKEYERFRRLMTAEANAAIEGALAGGADHVVVNDSHGPMTNILIEELNPAATLISGSPKPYSMMCGIDSNVDRMFFIGYHAAAGTSAAILEHTYTGTIFQVQLNGKVVGETGVNAALAGAYAVPVVLVTGDKAVTDEARTLLGDIETVAVKDSVTRTAAHCLHPEVARKYIREAAERALKLNVVPFALTMPVKLRVVFQQTLYADIAELVPGICRVDGRTIEFSGEDIPTVYKVFQVLKALARAA